VCPSPRNLRGGGHIRLRVRGWGSPNSDDWRKSLALCLLCGHPNSTPHYYIFCIFLWWATVCWPLLCLCRPFCIFERCLDLNPESCRSKLARYQLSNPSSWEMNALFLGVNNILQRISVISRRVQTPERLSKSGLVYNTLFNIDSPLRPFLYSTQEYSTCLMDLGKGCEAFRYGLI
jgi:hypothetical protein